MSNNVDSSTAITLKQQVVTKKVVQMEASLAVYIMALLSFFGWIFLVLFGGVGMFALPIDMIN